MQVQILGHRIIQLSKIRTVTMVATAGRMAEGPSSDGALSVPLLDSQRTMSQGMAVGMSWKSSVSGDVRLRSLQPSLAHQGVQTPRRHHSIRQHHSHSPAGPALQEHPHSAASLPLQQLMAPLCQLHRQQAPRLPMPALPLLPFGPQGAPYPHQSASQCTGRRQTSAQPSVRTGHPAQTQS